LLAFDMRTAVALVTRAPAGLATSPFGLLDAACSLRLVTDAVHEDHVLCLALTCRVLRNALWARFPVRSAGHPHAGKRLRTRDGEVAQLGSKVTIVGVLDLTNAAHWTAGNPGSDSVPRSTPGLRVLPEGVGRLAHSPWPGLKKLILKNNEELNALPTGLWSLTRLEELDLSGCELRVLPDGVAAMTGLRKLDLSSPSLHGRGGNELGMRTLPEGLWSLVGLQDLCLSGCGLTALPDGVAAMAGLRKLDLSSQGGRLRTLPEGLWSLVGLQELYLSYCGLTVLPEGVARLTGLKKLHLNSNECLTTLPEGLWSLVGLEDMSSA
jgi:hypothetical protein